MRLFWVGFTHCELECNNPFLYDINRVVPDTQKPVCTSDRWRWNRIIRHLWYDILYPITLFRSSSTAANKLLFFMISLRWWWEEMHSIWIWDPMNQAKNTPAKLTYYVRKHVIFLRVIHPSQPTSIHIWSRIHLTMYIVISAMVAISIFKGNYNFCSRFWVCTT